MSVLRSKKGVDPLLGVGVALSLALHGGLALAIVWEKSAPLGPPPPPPRDFVVARLARLGTKRPPNWLPVIPQRQAGGPKGGRRISMNADAAPSKKRDDERRVEGEAKAMQRADTLAKIFAEAQKEADQEGDPHGSPFGTAAEATPGDEYATRCAETVQQVWSVPPETLLSEETLARLSAEVRVVIDGKGKVHEAKVKKPSGNKYFDASLEDALGRLKSLPEPPKSLMGNYQRVGLILVFEGRNLRR